MYVCMCVIVCNIDQLYACGLHVPYKKWFVKINVDIII